MNTKATGKWLHRLHRIDVGALLAVTGSCRHDAPRQLALHISRSGDGWLCLALPMGCLAAAPSLAGRFAAVLALSLAIERTLYLVLKQGLRRSRPPQTIPGFRSVITAADEFSFPSGHTSAAFLVATACCCCLGSLWAPIYLWAAAVGASRVVLGVHFPSDTLAGAAIGTSIALAISRVVPS